MMKKLSQNKTPGNQHGFTLIEMSIVLLVIGLILGAVSVGKDVQRNAEYMKVKQKFIDQWAAAYDTFYLRTGTVVGDNLLYPSMIVNSLNAPVIIGGNLTGNPAPAELCDAALFAEMDRLGIRMPPGRAEGHEDRYVYLDSNGNPMEIQVCFRWNPPGTFSGSGNMMVIYGLTPDLARTLDQEIDGKPDSAEGMFRDAGLATNGIGNGTPGQPNAEWLGNNTNNMGTLSTVASAVPVVDASRLDEDQVYVFTAHYKMTQ